MSRTGYGLNRLEGGIRKGLRQALARIPTATCDLASCDEPAACVIDKFPFGHGYACAGHGRQAERLGYRVIRRGAR